MSDVKFFRSDLVIKELNELYIYCENSSSFSDNEKSKASWLLVALNFIAARREIFDERCGCNIDWLGESVAGRRRDLNRALTVNDLDLYLVTLYRFVSEYNISIAQKIEVEAEGFLDYIPMLYDSLSDDRKFDIDFVRHKMPTLILKKIVNDEKIGLLSNVPKVAEEVKKKVDDWHQSLTNHEEAVDKLRVTLESYENAFNFVALYKGFDILCKSKVKDLAKHEKNMKIFGGILMSVLICELFLIYYRQSSFNSASLVFAIGAGLISLSITLLLVYFFRIELKNADSCKSQISQIELRKTLCEFVQSYSKYAGDIKNSSPNTLEKFESIIFSNIVLNDEKMPSVFEGFEQVGGFVKTVQGK